MRPNKHLATRLNRIGLLRFAGSQTTVFIRIGKIISAIFSVRVRPHARNRNQRFPFDRQQPRLGGSVPLENRNKNCWIRDDEGIAIGIVGSHLRSPYQERRGYVIDAGEAPTVKRVMSDPIRCLPRRFCKQHLFEKNQRAEVIGVTAQAQGLRDPALSFG